MRDNFLSEQLVWEQSGFVSYGNLNSGVKDYKGTLEIIHSDSDILLKFISSNESVYYIEKEAFFKNNVARVRTNHIQYGALSGVVFLKNDQLIMNYASESNHISGVDTLRRITDSKFSRIGFLRDNNGNVIISWVIDVFLKSENKSNNRVLDFECANYSDLSEEKVVIYTDGACSGNPGPGGYGAIVYNKKNNTVVELGGGEKNTTNNKMEMTGAIEALRFAEREIYNSEVKGNISLYTDSQYLINGITSWIKGWKKNGWRKADKGEVLNKDLWVELDRLNSKFTIEWKYVKGHANNPPNERCDQIAVAFSLGRGIELFNDNIKNYQIKSL